MLWPSHHAGAQPTALCTCRQVQMHLQTQEALQHNSQCQQTVSLSNSSGAGRVTVSLCANSSSTGLRNQSSSKTPPTVLGIQHQGRLLQLAPTQASTEALSAISIKSPGRPKTQTRAAPAAAATAAAAAAAAAAPMTTPAGGSGLLTGRKAPLHCEFTAAARPRREGQCYEGDLSLSSAFGLHRTCVCSSVLCAVLATSCY